MRLSPSMRASAIGPPSWFHIYIYIHIHIYIYVVYVVRCFWVLFGFYKVVRNIVSRRNVLVLSLVFVRLLLGVVCFFFRLLLGDVCFFFGGGWWFEANFLVSGRNARRAGKKLN